MNEIDFMRHIDKTSIPGCHLWTGGVTASGYGWLYFEKAMRKAHRVALRLRDGHYPPHPMVVDHLCRNRRCVNPDHLDIVSHATNVARGFRAMKTHCLHGHELTADNVRRNKLGGRECKRCKADRELARYYAGKAMRRGRKRQQEMTDVGLGRLGVI